MKQNKPNFQTLVDEFMHNWGIEADGMRDELNEMLTNAYGDGFDDGCEHFVRKAEA